jgi:hypothetical protein
MLENARGYWFAASFLQLADSKNSRLVTGMADSGLF